jgi:hypothetical protein
MKKPEKIPKESAGVVRLNLSLQRHMRSLDSDHGKTWFRKFINGKWRWVAFRRIRSVDGVTIRIRFERNHKQPHFHIEYKTEHNASYRLPDCVRLAGKLPKGKETEMLKWAKKNSAKLMQEWKLMNRQ